MRKDNSYDMFEDTKWRNQQPWIQWQHWQRKGTKWQTL